MAKQEYVNYNEIADFAESLGKISFDLEKELETIDSKIKMLPGIWQGTAATNYYDRFVELSHNFIPAYEELMKAVLFLTSVGEGYDNLSNDLARRLKAELELGGFGFESTSSTDTTFAEGETPVPVEDTEEPDIINIPDTEEAQSTQTPVEETPTVEATPVEPTPAPSKPGATPSTPSSETVTHDTDTGTSTNDKPETTAKDSTPDNTSKDTKTDSNLTAKEKLANDLGNITAPSLGGNNNNNNKPQSSTGSSSDTITPSSKPTTNTPSAPASAPAPSASGNPSTSGGSNNNNNNNKKEDNNQFGSLKSIDEVAREVIRGNYGNGQERKDALAAAGYDYHQVQSRVNEILRGN